MEDLLTWLRAEIRKDIAGAEKILSEGPERRWYDRYHCVYPRDLIARGLAELALLDEMIPTIEELDQIAMSEGLGSMAFGEPVALLLRLMVSGYQNRPGFKPSWLD